jgi:hypothetical protein
MGHLPALLPNVTPLVSFSLKCQRNVNDVLSLT